MVVIFGVLFVLASHPMMGVIILMGVTLVYFYLLFVSMSSLWFGLVLVLIMLSGVLVLFTYMASLSPNEKFEVLGVLLGFMLVMILGLGKVYGYVIGSDYSFVSLSLWENNDVFGMLFMLVILLGVMFVVVKLVSKYGGALRVECEKESG